MTCISCALRGERRKISRRRRHFLQALLKWDTACFPLIYWLVVLLSKGTCFQKAKTNWEQSLSLFSKNPPSSWFENSCSYPKRIDLCCSQTVTCIIQINRGEHLAIKHYLFRSFSGASGCSAEKQQGGVVLRYSPWHSQILFNDGRRRLRPVLLRAAVDNCQKGSDNAENFYWVFSSLSSGFSPLIEDSSLLLLNKSIFTYHHHIMHADLSAISFFGLQQLREIKSEFRRICISVFFKSTASRHHIESSRY